MTHHYHAAPYDLSAPGFYFTDLEDFRAQAQSHRNEAGQLVEEFELQYIDGDKASLFSALSIDTATLALWFERFEAMAAEEAVKALWLAGFEGWPAQEVLDRLGDVALFEGTAEDYADYYLEDSGLLSEVPAALHYYIDSKALARDLVLGGDIHAFDVEGTSYVVWHW